jgi:hypothetical protein
MEILCYQQSAEEGCVHVLISEVDMGCDNRVEVGLGSTYYG